MVEEEAVASDIMGSWWRWCEKLVGVVKDIFVSLKILYYI